ncbi:IS21 family transposase [Methylobacterium isbiliense]|nr:IS21 family transposase [Methylobacterium isbiliense]
MRALSARGTSKSEIARLLQVSEGTVRYHLKRIEGAIVDGRSRQALKAAALSEVIDAWRERQAGRVNLVALHQFLQTEYGYAGSLKSVQRYYKRTYPAPAIRVRRRVETPAGAQAQVDWAHFPGVWVDGAPTDLLALHMVLSFSRMEAIIWSPSKTMLSWLSCHSRAFERLGGVPATVRVDNEKTAVVRGAGAWGVINPTYRRYANALKFHVDACPPRQPRCKGKVERKIADQRLSLSPYGEHFADVAALQAWTDQRLEARAIRRICPATGSSVEDAWRAERDVLTPLPDPLFEPFDAAVLARVGTDGLVAFEGRQYSVPFRFVGQTVEVRGVAGAVEVWKGGERIARHDRHTSRRVLLLQSHYDGPSTPEVIAPPPLGRMGARIQELAALPAPMRSIEFYAALAEVAR